MRGAKASPPLNSSLNAVLYSMKAPFRGCLEPIMMKGLSVPRRTVSQFLCRWCSIYTVTRAGCPECPPSIRSARRLQRIPLSPCRQSTMADNQSTDSHSAAPRRGASPPRPSCPSVRILPDKTVPSRATPTPVRQSQTHPHQVAPPRVSSRLCTRHLGLLHRLGSSTPATEGTQHQTPPHEG